MLVDLDQNDEQQVVLVLQEPEAPDWLQGCSTSQLPSLGVPDQGHKLLRGEEVGSLHFVACIVSQATKRYPKTTIHDLTQTGSLKIHLNKRGQISGKKGKNVGNILTSVKC